MPGDHYLFEPLGPHHNRAAFSCGVVALDRYFRQQASQDLQRNLAAVFVLRDTTSELVIGYYTLNATSLESTGLPPAVTTRLPRYPVLPAVLLGRLAVDERYQGQGFGELLLVDALRRSLATSEQIAAMAVVVDAKDDAARGFYERYGFQRFLDDEYRLFIPMTTIANL